MISYVCSNFDMPKFLSYIFAASSMNVCLLVWMRWNDKHDRCMLRFVMVDKHDRYMLGLG